MIGRDVAACNGINFPRDPRGDFVGGVGKEDKRFFLIRLAELEVSGDSVFGKGRSADGDMGREEGTPGAGRLVSLLGAKTMKRYSRMPQPKMPVTIIGLRLPTFSGSIFLEVLYTKYEQEN